MDYIPLGACMIRLQTESEVLTACEVANTGFDLLNSGLNIYLIAQNIHCGPKVDFKIGNNYLSILFEVNSVVAFKKSNQKH